jgi:hypothetical protein
MQKWLMVEGAFGWKMSSRGLFLFRDAADFPLHDGSPYAHADVCRES